MTKSLSSLFYKLPKPIIAIKLRAVGTAIINYQLSIFTTFPNFTYQI